MKRLRVLLASAVFGSTLLMATPASAQPVVVVGDGLVNVVVTDVIDDVTVVVQDINVAVGVAAQIAANICGVKVGPVAVLGAAIDAGRRTEFVCENTQTLEEVTITQN